MWLEERFIYRVMRRMLDDNNEEFNGFGICIPKTAYCDIPIEKLKNRWNVLRASISISISISTQVLNNTFQKLQNQKFMSNFVLV
jgi:hypothetical protein